MMHAASASVDFADVFNKKLTEFLIDLESVGITRVKEYPMLKMSLLALAHVDKSKPAKGFLKYVVGPYESQIVQRDDAFFMSQDFSTVSDMAIVGAIKQIWTTLEDNNKDAIWRHVQLLTALCKRVTLSPQI
jgi:hypothetical protein